MANRYGTKYKSITWNCDTPLELTSANLGYSPDRRAHIILISELTAANTVTWKQRLEDGGALHTVDGVAATSTGIIYINDFNDVTDIRPGSIRLEWAAGGAADPGDVTVEVISKHIPSTMRKQ